MSDKIGHYYRVQWPDGADAGVECLCEDCADSENLPLDLEIVEFWEHLGHDTGCCLKCKVECVSETKP